MFLAAMLGVFLILLVIKPDLTLKGLALKIVTPVASTIGGFAQGATGVSGPVFTPLIFSMRMPKEAFIYYHGILYGFFNVVQIACHDLVWIVYAGAVLPRPNLSYRCFCFNTWG